MHTATKIPRLKSRSLAGMIALVAMLPLFIFPAVTRGSTASWPCLRECNDNRTALAALDREVVSCLATFESMKCKTFLDSNPDLKAYARQCSHTGYCEEKDKDWASTEAFKICAQVIGPAGAHALSEMLSLPITLPVAIYKTALFLGQSMQDSIARNREWRESFLQECNRDDEGKRNSSTVLIESADGKVLVAIAPNIGSHWKDLSCNEILQRTVAYHESTNRSALLSDATRGVYSPTTDQEHLRSPPEFPAQARACLNKEAQIAAGCSFLTKAGANVLGGYALGKAVGLLVKQISSSPQAKITKPESAREIAFGRLRKSESVGVSALPKATVAPLPRDFVDALLSHPRIRELQKQHGTGKDLSVHFDFFEGDSGEAVQSRFVAKVLKEIWPDIEINGPGHGRTKFDLDIFDSAEQGSRVTARDTGDHLEMALTKLANPGPATLPKPHLRSTLGIPEESRVVSLNNSLYNTEEEVLELLKKTRDLKPNLVIVSSSSESLGDLLSRRAVSALGSEWKTVNLSELHSTPLESGKRYVVINDTRGVMYAVYGASDVNITAGAVNLSEPLLARTPTVFFDSKSRYMHGYNAQTFDAMANTAVASGGAVEVGTLNEMGAAAKEILARPRRTTFKPPWQIGPPGATPLDSFADHLCATVEKLVPGSK